MKLFAGLNVSNDTAKIRQIHSSSHKKLVIAQRNTEKRRGKQRDTEKKLKNLKFSL
jgi:hypothetical protein